MIWLISGVHVVLRMSNKQNFSESIFLTDLVETFLSNRDG